MRASLMLLAGLSALASAAPTSVERAVSGKTDDYFYIYSVHEWQGGALDGGVDVASYYLFLPPDEPDCAAFDKAQANMFPIHTDVSGSRHGVRVKSTGKDMKELDIEELEWNDDLVDGHYTIYKDRGYEILPAKGVGLGTKSHGTCVVDKSDDAQCVFGVGDNFQARRQFKCHETWSLMSPL